MNKPSASARYLGLFNGLALFIIVADQLSKAWFVFLLGRHDYPTFAAFLGPYFSLFSRGEAMIQANFLPPTQVVKLWNPWIQWQLTTNTGAAWSMFRGNSIYLSIVSIVIAVALIVVWRRYFSERLSMTLIFGLIVGGALGNFLDRLRLREVVDFVDVKLPLLGKLIPSLGDPYDFPIFNVADSAAVVGTLSLALMLIIMDIHSLTRRKKASGTQGSSNPFEGGLAVEPEALDELKETARQVRQGERFTPRSQTGWSGNLPSAGAGGVPDEDPAHEDR